MAGAHRAATFRQHIRSWRFVATLLFLELVKYGFGFLEPVERATLGGFDSIARLANRLAPRDSVPINTVIVGITAEDVQQHFRSTRPVPPDALVNVVRRIMRLGPRVLVVDVFTEDSTYARDSLLLAPLYEHASRLVWARAVDTLSNEVLPVLGGASPAPGTWGMAALLLDADLQARRFRPRYVVTGPDAATWPHGLIPTLPLVAAARCRDLGDGTADPCAKASDAEAPDTSSVALRIYTRDPPMYHLGDVLAAAESVSPQDTTPLTDRIVVLGFVDGSDQAVTPWGIRAGPFVVADAIETLIDPRGLVRELPHWVSLAVDALLALLVAWLFFRFSPPVAARLLLLLAVGTFALAVYVFSRLGFWSDPVFIVVGIWLEQWYEDVTARPTETATEPSRGDRGTLLAVAAAPKATESVESAPQSEEDAGASRTN